MPILPISMKHLITAFWMCFFAVKVDAESTQVFSDSTQMDLIDSVNATLDRSAALVYKNPKSSHQYVTIALEMAIELDLKKEQASAYNILGNLANVAGDYVRALDYFLMFYKIAEQLQTTVDMAKASNGLGLVYKNIGDYHQSLIHYHNALNFNVPFDSTLASKFYNNIGVVYKNIEQYDSARYYFNKSFEIKKIIGSQRSIANVLTNLGNVLGLNGDNQGAIALFEQALELEKEAGLTEGVAKSYNNMALAYLNLSQIDSAIYFAAKGLAIAQEIKTKLQIKEAAEVLSQGYAKSMHFQKAFQFQTLAYQMKDSLTNEEMARSVGRYESRLELEKKENENHVLRSENRIQHLELSQAEQRFFLIVLVALLLMAGVVFLWIFYRLKRKLLTAEIDELRAKINANLIQSGVKLNVPLEIFNSKVHNELTEREYEILKLAITQKSNSKIAEEIFVSVNTVKFHLKNIFNKLGVANKVEALELVTQKHS